MTSKFKQTCYIYLCEIQRGYDFSSFFGLGSRVTDNNCWKTFENGDKTYSTISYWHKSIWNSVVQLAWWWIHVYLETFALICYFVLEFEEKSIISFRLHWKYFKSLILAGFIYYKCSRMSQICWLLSSWELKTPRSDKMESI